MFESSVIQAFLNEGREEGIGIGAAREARRAVAALIQDKFGAVDSRLHHHLAGISDIVELENLIVRAGKVANWEELLLK